MWRNIKQIWSEAWTAAKQNWKAAWNNSKTAIIAFVKAIAGWVWAVLQTVILLPLYTGVCKTGKLVLGWLIGKIMRV